MMGKELTILWVIDVHDGRVGVSDDSLRNPGDADDEIFDSLSNEIVIDFYSVDGLRFARTEEDLQLLHWNQVFFEICSQPFRF